MYGIPTTTTDYRVDPKIFDIGSFGYRPGRSDETNKYWLRKAIVAAYRLAHVPAREAERIATRNLDAMLVLAKSPGLAPVSGIE